MDEITVKIDKEVANASKTPREILQLIFEMAYKTVEPDDIKNRITMARFASLLVNLSEQADKITQENLQMQRKLVCLNWTLIFLTAGLFIATIALLVWTDGVCSAVAIVGAVIGYAAVPAAGFVIIVIGGIIGLIIASSFSNSEQQRLGQAFDAAIPLNKRRLGEPRHAASRVPPPPSPASASTLPAIPPPALYPSDGSFSTACRSDALIRQRACAAFISSRPAFCRRPV